MGLSLVNKLECVNKQLHSWDSSFTHQTLAIQQFRLVPDFHYRIAQNAGRGNLWRIWQNQRNLPKFYPFKYVNLASSIFFGCHFKNITATPVKTWWCLSWSRYMRPLKQKSDLPNPVGPLSKKVPSSAISAAHKNVIEVLNDAQERKKRTRGPYLFLTPAQKYEIGKKSSRTWRYSQHSLLCK